VLSGRSRAALLAFASAAAWAGCFYEVTDHPSGGGAGAAATGSTTGETTATGAGGTGTGGITRLPCTVPDAGCEVACPAGSECINGCCEIASAPPGCASAIDVTAGGRFHATVCGGPQPDGGDPECSPNHPSPYLLLRVEQSPVDGGSFTIATDPDDYPDLRVALPCGDSQCLKTSPPWTVDGSTTFAFQRAQDDPCAPFVFDVKP
jgi:hypothetical protein